MREFTGTLTLTWLAIRRDRIQLPIWIVALGVMAAFFTATYDDLFDTAEELFVAAEFYAGNPATRIFGLSSGPSLGEYTLVRSFMIFTVLAGLMSVLAVVRHTRQNEETRAAEVIGSAVTGRYASAAAALILAAIANTAVAGALALGFIVNGLPVGSSLLAGAAVAAAGMTFAGVAVITAQVYSSSRGASGLAVGFIGFAFALASMGSVLGTVQEDGVRVAPMWLTWLSPIGWGQLTRPFGGDNLWPFLFFTASFVGLMVIAFALNARRDVGMGLVPESRGPARAPRSLLSPVGLVWRLQRGVFFGWAAGLIGFGLVFGAMSADIEEALGELDAVEIFERIGGTDQIIDAYFVAIMGVMGTIVSAYSVQVLLRMRMEESDGPLESVLGAALSRPRWMLSYVINAALGTIVLLVLLGASAGLAAGIAMDDVWTWLRSLTEAALVQAPATLVVAGAAVAAFSFLPRRAAAISWAAFAIALLAGPMFGEMFNLPQAVMDISPFTHVPRLPAADFELVPVAVLSAIAAALIAAGFAYFRRRDLALQ